MIKLIYRYWEVWWFGGLGFWFGFDLGFGFGWVFSQMLEQMAQRCLYPSSLQGLHHGTLPSRSLKRPKFTLLKSRHTFFLQVLLVCFVTQKWFGVGPLFRQCLFFLLWLPHGLASALAQWKLFHIFDQHLLYIGVLSSSFIVWLICIVDGGHFRAGAPLHNYFM